MAIDPNELLARFGGTTFNIPNQALIEAKDKHFPEQVTRFDKYKH